MIWPSLWIDEELEDLPLAARLLFVAMFSNADDEGREKHSARKWRKLVFAATDSHYDHKRREVRKLDCEEIDRLAEGIATMKPDGPGPIILYEAGGVQLYQCTNWWRYQSIQYPKASSYPPPDGYVCGRVATGGRPLKLATDKQREAIRARCAALNINPQAFLKEHGLSAVDELTGREVRLVFQKLEQHAAGGKRCRAAEAAAQLTFAIRARDARIVGELLDQIREESWREWPDVRSTVLVGLGFDPTGVYVGPPQQFAEWLVDNQLLGEK